MQSCTRLSQPLLQRLLNDAMRMHAAMICAMSTALRSPRTQEAISLSLEVRAKKDARLHLTPLPIFLFYFYRLLGMRRSFPWFIKKVIGWIYLNCEEEGSKMKKKENTWAEFPAYYFLLSGLLHLSQIDDVIRFSLHTKARIFLSRRKNKFDPCKGESKNALLVFSLPSPLASRGNEILPMCTLLPLPFHIAEPAQVREHETNASQTGKEWAS